jgi:hypothetical protein
LGTKHIIYANHLTVTKEGGGILMDKGGSVTNGNKTKLCRKCLRSSTERQFIKQKNNSNYYQSNIQHFQTPDEQKERLLFSSHMQQVKWIPKNRTVKNHAM